MVAEPLPTPEPHFFVSSSASDGWSGVVCGRGLGAGAPLSQRAGCRSCDRSDGSVTPCASQPGAVAFDAADDPPGAAPALLEPVAPPELAVVEAEAADVPVAPLAVVP